jgi:hypothetical protein
MNNIKLQLDVKLKQSTIIGMFKTFELYWVHVKVLDKDDRFESKLTKNLSYHNENGIYVKSLWDKPFGTLNYNEIVLPSLDRIGFELKLSFYADEARYRYLRHLYDVLEDWANYWDGFNFDSASYILLDDNLWTIKCRRKNKSSIIVHSHRDELRNNLIF